MSSGIYNHKKGRHWKVKDTSKIKEASNQLERKKRWKDSISLFYKNGGVNGMKNRKHREDSKQKIKEKRALQIITKETKDKLKITSAGERNGMFGRKQKDESKIKIIKGLKEYDRTHPGKRAKKASETSKGNTYTKGMHFIHSEKANKLKSEYQINHPNRKFSNTKIEQKIAAELTKRGIYYQQNIGMCNIANVDFYLPKHRIVIQADGDYWHNLPGRKECDIAQDKVLSINGFNVYRFWEHEINKSPEACVNKVI